MTHVVDVDADGGKCDHCLTPLIYAARLDDGRRVGETCLTLIGLEDKLTGQRFKRLRQQKRLAVQRAARNAGALQARRQANKAARRA